MRTKFIKTFVLTIRKNGEIYKCGAYNSKKELIKEIPRELKYEVDDLIYHGNSRVWVGQDEYIVIIGQYSTNSFYGE